MKFAIILSILTLLSGCANSESIRYTQGNPLPNQTPKEVNLIINSYVKKNPSPTIIYAHGCSGLDGAYLDWKNKLNDWGYNVIQPDSLRSRGFSTACANSGVANIRHDDRLEDLLRTAEWVAKQSWHAGKIGVIGFSMGGRAVLNLASDGGDLYRFQATADSDVYKNKNVSAAVALYAFCQLEHKNSKIPTLILNGAEDKWTPSTWCERIEKENSLIEAIIYPGVYHGFDTPGASGVNSVGHRNQYDKKIAADAEKRIKEFFEKNLKN